MTAISESLLITDVAASLEAAKSRAALIQASQQIQYVEGIAQRERLSALFNKRFTEFKENKRK